MGNADHAVGLHQAEDRTGFPWERLGGLQVALAIWRGVLQPDPDIILPSGGGGNILGQPGAGRAQRHKGRIRGLAPDHPHQRRTEESKNDQRRHRVTGQPHDRLAGGAGKDRRLARSNGNTVKEEFRARKGTDDIQRHVLDAHRTAAGHHHDISGFQRGGERLGKRLRIIFDDPQVRHGPATFGNHGVERILVHIPNLTRAGRA